MDCHVGLLNSVPSPLLCEMFGAAGYHFAVLDLEHLLVSPDDLQHAIRACEIGGCEPWVRVPEVDTQLIGRVLDAGATGVVIPRLETAAQARRAVEAAHFPPLGRRGITGGRVTGFGKRSLADYIAGSRDAIRVIPMIESDAGIDALPDILAVPGISLVMEGALDLALDLGLGPDPLHPRVWQRLLDLAGHCDEAGIPFCANPRNAAQREHWLARHPRWLLAGEDRGLLMGALRARRRELTTDLSSLTS
ncbi:aldolase/citrate lyase family protein [Luteibacter sp. PPL201]|uniref:Aldolase/citrate lyase family protein n=1 Tax=Luteibacter sahnii TaxID=3021977 RepID=A0ABT6BD82_9GAMM